MVSHSSIAPYSAALHWRLLAALYDLLPLLAIWFCGAALLLLMRGGRPVEPGSAMAWFELIWLGILGFAYFAVSWRHGGQTMGMRAWRLRLKTVRGGAPSWRMLALRFLAALLSTACIGLGWLWCWFDSQQRCWQDMASGTIIVREPKAHR